MRRILTAISQVIIGRLIQFVPNAYAYSDDFAYRMNVGEYDVEEKVHRFRPEDDSHDGIHLSDLHTANITLAIAAGKHLPKIGDTMTFDLIGLTEKTADCGSFRVTVERISAVD